MPRRYLANNVFDAAVDRMVEIYAAGHRVVVAFSAGKDSGVSLEVSLIAAQMTGKLPVEVLMRDEEIMLPGTFEYAERVAARPDVKFHWIYANQPVLNLFNREMPYYWVFDPLLQPDEWVRTPPSIAYFIPDMNIEKCITPERFPPPEGKELYSVLGLRVSESRQRLLGLFSSGGAATVTRWNGARDIRPVYDWQDGDVWKAIYANKWDYNDAYDVMNRMGIPRNRLRIAPPAMNPVGADALGLAAKAWPKWFDKVCKRLPGVRQAAHYGRRAVQPVRRLNETWEQCFVRTCITDAPKWIADRSEIAMKSAVEAHAHHSTDPLPEVVDCPNCSSTPPSWKSMAMFMYGGDAFSSKVCKLPYIEPEFFRPGAGKWNGTPAFK